MRLMRARARLVTAVGVDGGGRPVTRVAGLRSEVPLVLRPTLPPADPPYPAWAEAMRACVTVALVAGAAGPLGGDELRLEITVGADSALTLTEVGATLLLPGPRGAESRLTVEVVVEAGATLVWVPEPVIAARGCRHWADVRIALADDARLLVREELLLGREGEAPGEVRQRLRVRRGGRPLYDQELVIGPAGSGFAGPAVLGGARAVDPVWEGLPVSGRLLGEGAALMPLAGPGALVTALAGDTLSLRRTLEAGLVWVGGYAISDEAS